MTENIKMEQEVLDALASGNKVSAIKIIRAKRGLGLKESKELVDRYLELHPALITSTPPNLPVVNILLVGCLVLLVFFTYQHFLG